MYFRASLPVDQRSPSTSYWKNGWDRPAIFHLIFHLSGENGSGHGLVPDQLFIWRSEFSWGSIDTNAFFSVIVFSNLSESPEGWVSYFISEVLSESEMDSSIFQLLISFLMLSPSPMFISGALTIHYSGAFEPCWRIQGTSVLLSGGHRGCNSSDLSICSSSSLPDCWSASCDFHLFCQNPMFTADGAEHYIIFQFVSKIYLSISWRGPRCSPHSAGFSNFEYMACIMSSLTTGRSSRCCSQNWLAWSVSFSTVAPAGSSSANSYFISDVWR